jgi:hypothetical protein
MFTVQMGSAHCASQTGLARGFRSAWPFSPRPKSRGALAVDASWRRSGRLWPVGGMAARALGGGEGPVRGGIGVGGGSPVAIHGGDGGGDRWSPVVLEWSVTGYASEGSSWRRLQGQSMAGGGGARRGTHGGSGGGTR